VKALFYLCLLLLSGQAFADNQPPSQENDALYTPIGQWQFSIALGAGQKSNPLRGGKDIPLYLVPSLHYYGEQFYFDDGTLGYSFFENQRFTLSALVTLNSHAANFSRWHPSNIFIPDAPLLGEVDLPLEDTEQKEQTFTAIDIAQLAKRKWALDGGLQFNYFSQNHLMFQARWTRDISQVYRGDSLSLKVEKSFSLVDSNKLQLKVASGVNWHSANLVDYYYGISTRDDVSTAQYYQGRATTNWFASSTLTYHIAPQWRAIMTLQTLKLGAGINDSPLLKSSNISTWFMGIAYDF